MARPSPSDAVIDLPPAAFRRADESDDARFYVWPRLVNHIDDGARAAVTDLYRQHLAPGDDVLDLMSSWVSHLPPELELGRVAGLGMNGKELAENPRLSEWTVQSLNASPALPYDDGAFDAALCCVSVQYLTRPVEVFAQVGRVLRPGAPFVVTFSNRCFPTKAVAAWRALDDDGHAALVAEYARQSDAFQEAEVTVHRPRGGDPLVGVVAERLA